MTDLQFACVATVVGLAGLLGFPDVWLRETWNFLSRKKPEISPAEKISLIKEHFDEQRKNSPDGMTAWERVEKYRDAHGGQLPPRGYKCNECDRMITDPNRLEPDADENAICKTCADNLRA